MPTWVAVAVAAAVVVVLVLRLAGLGDRPMHHDESLDAWWAWRLVTGEGYSYDPPYHGPSRIFATAAVFQLVGDGDAAARAIASIAGLAVVATPLLVRRTLGAAGTSTAMALLAVSPTLVYVSRLGREDTVFLLAATVAALTFAELLREPRRWHPPVIGVAAGLAATTKVSYLITATILVGFLAALVAGDLLRSRSDPHRRSTTLRRLAAPGADSWAWAVAAFTTIFVVLFSAGFTDPAGVWRGLVDGPVYWLGQHEVERSAQPPGFHAILLAAYELPVLVLALAGAVRALRRPDVVPLFLLWSAAAHFVIYSWAGERYPWLVVHITVPLALLAAYGVAGAWEHRRRLGGAVLLSATTVGLVWMVVTAARTSHVAPTDPRELLVAVQTTEEVPPVVEALRARAVGSDGRVVVDVEPTGSWPLPWYLRDLPVEYLDLSEGPVGELDAAVVADAHLAGAVDPGRYDVTPFALWSSWVPDYGDATIGDWLAWFWSRRTWNEPYRQVMHLVVPAAP